ncbi:MAG: cupin domain-containing protein [Candidatus Bathyarchaeota archaeon]|nr:cupin domain-containing protein [Candidatus Bathyarchaeota archaeon]MDH5624070.1 cupin domain-containing protein [Candidatus Bathyarchaeota archaeon]MDH5701876.1 cupin domain-containing protein [Candidatus Bathyarchaeota archaeon]
MYVANVEKVREYKITEEGAYKVKVKYLLHKGVGAKRLQLRLFTIDVGGHTPLEKHAHEHEVFVLRGRVLVRGGDKEVVLGPRNVIFIPSYEEHQLKNIGNEPVEFLCTKETGEIPEVLKKGG